MKFRKGDRVSLEGTIVELYAGVSYVVDVMEGHTGGNAHLMMKEGQLKLVEPAPPAVGDVVAHKDDKSVAYDVLGIWGANVWVCRQDDKAAPYQGAGFYTFRTGELVVVKRGDA
jgi:hypothetical protein